jgi:hypothetical protein
MALFDLAGSPNRLWFSTQSRFRRASQSVSPLSDGQDLVEVSIAASSRLSWRSCVMIRKPHADRDLLHSVERNEDCRLVASSKVPNPLRRSCNLRLQAPAFWIELSDREPHIAGGYWKRRKRRYFFCLWPCFFDLRRLDNSHESNDQWLIVSCQWGATGAFIVSGYGEGRVSIPQDQVLRWIRSEPVSVRVVRKGSEGFWWW